MTTNCGGTKKKKKNKKQKVPNLCGFSKIERCHKKGSLSFTLMEEVLDMVARHEIYFFLHDFSNYFMIALEDRYKTTFNTDWGTFVQMSCHLD